jgi:DHA1 family quinolone resistance protein-like MFS transporter
MSKKLQLFKSEFKRLSEGLKRYFKINKILRTLVLSDVIILSAYGLMAPIFAVYLTDSIVGGSLLVVGVAETIYLLVKSLLQIPIGILIDRTEGEKIDFWLVFSGSLIEAACIFAYIFASTPIHIYIISFFFGIGSAMMYPAWMGLFTRNMEKGKESFVWSLHTTPTELGAAFAAGLGALIADTYGFDFLFAIVGGFTVFGTLILYSFYDEIVD